MSSTHTCTRVCDRCSEPRDIALYPYLSPRNNRRGRVCMVCEPLFTDEEVQSFKDWLRAIR